MGLTVGVVVTRSLPMDGGIVEDHGAPEAGNFRGPGPMVAKRQKSPKSEPGKESVASQRKMR